MTLKKIQHVGSHTANGFAVFDAEIGEQLSCEGWQILFVFAEW